MFDSISTTVSNVAHLKILANLNEQTFAQTFHSQPKNLQHSRVLTMIEKASVDRVNWDISLIGNPETIAFLKTLRRSSFFAAGIDAGAFWKVPFYTKAAASSSYTIGAILESGESIPASSFDFDAPEMAKRHAYALVVITKELAKGGGAAATNTLKTLLGDACGSAIDEQVSTQMRNNAGTESFVSTGSSSENFLADFRLMLDHVNIRGAGPLYWVASRTAANRLNFDSVILQGAGPQGGEILGVPLIVSDGLIDDSTGGTLMLIDSGKIAANVESLRLDVAEHASLQMDSAPVSGEEAVHTSLFQTNSVALKATLTFGCELLIGFRAATLTGIE